MARGSDYYQAVINTVSDPLFVKDRSFRLVLVNRHRKGLEMELAPMVLDCEVAGSKRYWEGPVSVKGTRNGKPFMSEGYQELVRRP